MFGFVEHFAAKSTMDLVRQVSLVRANTSVHWLSKQTSIPLKHGSLFLHTTSHMKPLAPSPNSMHRLPFCAGQRNNNNISNPLHSLN